MSSPVTHYDLMNVAKKSAIRAAAFYGAVALTPLTRLIWQMTPAGTLDNFVFSPSDIMKEVGLFFGVDVMRQVIINPYLDNGYGEWTHESMGPGGDWMKLSNLWDNLSVAVFCKACAVQSLLYYGVLRGMGTHAAGTLAIASFVSNVLLEFVMGFMQPKAKSE